MFKIFFATKMRRKKFKNPSLVLYRRKLPRFNDCKRVNIRKLMLVGKRLTCTNPLPTSVLVGLMFDDKGNFRVDSIADDLIIFHMAMNPLHINLLNVFYGF